VTFYADADANKVIGSYAIDGFGTCILVPHAGQDIWWKCSGSDTVSHTRASYELGAFPVLLTMEPKTTWWGTTKTSGRLQWGFLNS
jgi:hypothetical protein